LSAAARRLFFALWPGDEVRQALFHWQVHNLPGDVRWQHRADLHMTLHFLGQVEAERLDALHELGAAVWMRSFSLVLDRIGHFPRPQVLWAGVSTLPDELAALHARLGEGLRARGFTTEARPFHAHVTLARKVRRCPEAAPLVPLCWPVDGLVLVESRGGEVPHYHPIGRWPVA
jgi:2'-5' RNA ligase